ncbi:unnamed protein product [Cyprideis torosa]|uniref:Uncharacterized protein n=1 Tax=Cyprideis torosa TaxID=163714 RepID=A0A7R8W864_9CRUS|nr:unnamed protein product [Cyprideis torosa]CAG0888270.1 unnamed protein product [Cyprideis torosa]
MFVMSEANSNTKDSSMSAPTSIKSTQISPDFVKLFSPPSPDPAATESARFTGELPFNYKLIFKELWEQGETLPEWNSQVEIFHYLKEISSNFIIGYQITAPLAFGLVSQRDFVGLAHYEFEESKNTLWLTTVSVEFSGMPELEKYVRGFHLPGSGVKLEASQESPENKTIFTWIFIPDLKFGYIPSSIMKKVLPAQIKLYYESLRARLFQVYPSNHL